MRGRRSGYQTSHFDVQYWESNAVRTTPWSCASAVPGKEKSTIFDFIVVPTTNPDAQLVESEKGILKKELRRFEEFAASAMNEVEARNKIGHLRFNIKSRSMKKNN